MTFEERLEKIEEENRALRSQTRKLRKFVVAACSLAFVALAAGTVGVTIAATPGINPLTVSTIGLTASQYVKVANVATIQAGLFEINGILHRLRLDGNGFSVSYGGNSAYLKWDPINGLRVKKLNG